MSVDCAECNLGRLVTNTDTSLILQELLAAQTIGDASQRHCVLTALGELFSSKTSLVALDACELLFQASSRMHNLVVQDERCFAAQLHVEVDLFVDAVSLLGLEIVEIGRRRRLHVLLQFEVLQQVICIHRVADLKKLVGVMASSQGSELDLPTMTRNLHHLYFVVSVARLHSLILDLKGRRANEIKVNSQSDRATSALVKDLIRLDGKLGLGWVLQQARSWLHNFALTEFGRHAGQGVQSWLFH